MLCFLQRKSVIPLYYTSGIIHSPEQSRKGEGVGKSIWQISQSVWLLPYKHFLYRFKNSHGANTKDVSHVWRISSGLRPGYLLQGKESSNLSAGRKGRGRVSAFPGSMPLIIQLYSIYICFLPIFVLMDQINMSSTS